MDKIFLALQRRYPNIKLGDYELVLSPYNNQYTVTKWLLNETAPTSSEIYSLISQDETNFKWAVIREKRNGLLEKSDWTALSDVNIANKVEWEEYRQQLRDITTAFPRPEDVVWPTPPAQ